MSTSLSTLNTLISERRRDASGLSLDMTEDGFRAVVGALQVWDQQHDWPWQVERYGFNYNPGITEYVIPSSLAFKTLKDIRPRLDSKQELTYISNNAFDSDVIHNYKFAIKQESQEKRMRLKYTGYSQVVSLINTVSDNGTWVGASAVSNVAKDVYESFSGLGSLKFDYSGTSGTLTNSTLNAVDLSRYEARSTFYFDIFLQDVTNFTSATLKVGSSASDYVTGAITTDHLGNELKNGWNTLKLTWDGTTSAVGTVDSSAVNYIEFTIAYSSDPSTTSNRIENLFISENVPMVLEYYSHFMAFDDSSGLKVQTFNDGGDPDNDYPLWSGEWDFVNEAFVNSVLEITTWMTGETSDRQVAIQRINAFVEPLKSRLPSSRRYPKMSIVPELN